LPTTRKPQGSVQLYEVLLRRPNGRESIERVQATSPENAIKQVRDADPDRDWRRWHLEAAPAGQGLGTSRYQAQ
jgi:hypothetical protein